jgi:hypothetical protein
MMDLKVAKVFALLGACAAAFRNVAGMGRNLIQKIVVMRVLLEVIAAAVRHDTLVEYIDFADRPAVEACSRFAGPRKRSEFHQ